jgi:hypothetical protein
MDTASAFAPAPAFAPATVAQTPATAPALPVPTPRVATPIFAAITLPEDGVTLNHKKFYSLTQIAAHLNISKTACINAVKRGELVTIIQPGLGNGKRLVAVEELIRFLNR